MSEETDWRLSIAKHIWLSPKNPFMFVLEPEHRRFSVRTTAMTFFALQNQTPFLPVVHEAIFKQRFCVRGRDRRRLIPTLITISIMCVAAMIQSLKNAILPQSLNIRKRLMWLKWRRRVPRAWTNLGRSGPGRDLFQNKPIKRTHPSDAGGHNPATACFGLGPEQG